MIRLLTPLLALALLLAACADEVGGGAPAGSGAACTRSSECSDPDARCVQGRCEVECVEDRDCQPGASCQAGRCDDSAQDGTCRDDSACPFGEVCISGTCGVDPDGCTRNSDCPDGMECSRMTLRCIDPEAVECLSDAQCPDGTCQANRCIPLPDEEDAAPDAPAEEDAPPDATTEEDAPPDAPEPDADLPDAEPDDADLPDVDPPDAEPDDATINPGGDDAEPSDAEPDAAEPDAAEPDAAEPDTGPPPTPEQGSYRYQRIPVGGLKEAVAVAFHPSGDYALILERDNVVHVFDWATLQATRLEVGPANSRYTFQAVTFAPGGGFALLAGSQGSSGALVRFDDAAWRQGPERTLPLFTPQPEAARSGETFVGVAWPWTAGELPMVLSNNGASGNTIARLRRFDPDAAAFTDFIAARNSSAGCNDLAWVNNEFGEPGVLVVCGSNGADVLYYTWVAGIGEWRDNPGNNNLGNTSRVAAYPGGAYALVVSWSGRAVYRFQDGSLNSYADAPRFSTEELWGVRFQQEGQRALVFGGVNAPTPIRANLREYRHDLYTCGAACPWTDVAIPSFDAAPWNGTTSWSIQGADWRAGCDGGLLVGGFTNFQGSTGFVATFQLEGQRPCR